MTLMLLHVADLSHANFVFITGGTKESNGKSMVFSTGFRHVFRPSVRKTKAEHSPEKCSAGLGQTLIYTFEILNPEGI